jgi:hypothetical protein
MLTDEAFPDDGKEWADAVGVTLGFASGTLEVFNADDDPRTGALLEDPNVSLLAPPPPPTFEQLVAQATSFAELKRLVAEQLA